MLRMLICVKYVGCFQDTVYTIQHTFTIHYKEMSAFQLPDLYSTSAAYEVASLILCGITLI